MKKKNSNKTFIILAAIITVIAVAVLVAVSVLKSGSSTKDKSKVKLAEITDTISRLVESSDLEVKYVNSNKRTIIYLIGSEGYYGIRYTDANKLFILEGTYERASNIADKIEEAEEGINSNNGATIFADNVMRFDVSGADLNGFFPDRKVKVDINIDDADGNRSTGAVEATIPEKAVEEETPAE